VTRAEGPLVSLIMPVWRPRREWFQAAVRSALGQRGCEIELIIVDDGNPAPVAELLADVDHPALRLLRVEHGGPSHARNAGIAAAHGRLLRFVDADDVYEPQSTARLARRIDADDVIAYGRTVFCDEQLRPVWTMSSGLEGSVAPQAMLCRFSVRIQSLLFPRAVVDAAGPWDTSLVVCGDLDFIVRATEHARVRGDPAVATYYRKHGGSVSSDITQGDEGIRRMMERYVERHPNQRAAGVERRAAAARHAVAARAYASRGLLAPSLRRLLRSLRVDPRAATVEATAALPAAWGHLRHALSPRPSPTLQLDLPPTKRPPVGARSDALG
jgi:glycosyltransferase involved in cell wall biosynthesis